MATGAVIAAALTDHGARPKALWIGGVDMLKEPGSVRYGVPIESVQIIEAGPAGVSELLFDLDDPQRQIGLADGMDVAMADLTLDWPTFRGLIDSAEAEPAFGGQGRQYHVRCTGIEALLDWYIVPANMAFGTSTRLLDAIQSLVDATGAPLRAFSDPAAFLSTIANPVEGDLSTLSASIVVEFGTTLRQAIAKVIAAYSGTLPIRFTVDFRGGLRVWTDVNPGDVRAIAIDETTAGGNAVGSSLRYGINAAAIRTVVVRNGSGINVTVNDGTGKLGPLAVLTDTTIASTAAAIAAGQAYLAANRATASGSVRFENTAPFGPFGGAAAGATAFAHMLILVSTGLGISGGAFVDAPITSITKTFRPGGHEDWTVEFGATAQRASHYLRRLTRSTISA